MDGWMEGRKEGRKEMRCSSLSEMFINILNSPSQINSWLGGIDSF